MGAVLQPLKPDLSESTIAEEKTTEAVSHLERLADYSLPHALSEIRAETATVAMHVGETVAGQQAREKFLREIARRVGIEPVLAHHGVHGKPIRRA